MAITSIEGERLVGSHRAGDPGAFPTIVKAHYPALLARARHRLHDQQLAEDAVQEALLRAYRSLPSFGGFGEFHLTAWLYRILENVCIDEANRRRRSLAVVERLAAQPEELAPDAETAARLPDPEMSAALQGLPSSYRNALIQREVEGLSYADMAAAAGITEDNARARVSRARSALRRLVAPIVTAVAWIIGTSRRGERVLLDGATHAASTSSASAAGAAVAPVSIHIPAASHVISQVTAVVPESQMVSAIKVATAAVIAVALPVGGVTAAKRTNPPPAPPAVEVVQSPTASSVPPAGATAAPEAGTDEEVEADGEDGASGEADGAEPELLSDEIAGGLADETVADPESTEETTVDEEPDGSSEEAITEDEPAGETSDEVAEDGSTAPPSESAVVIDAAHVGRNVLDDGRYEFSGPVGFTTSAGEVEGRLSLSCAVPGEGDDPDGEYRLAGSILTSGDHAGRIRLAGTMEAWSVDPDGRTTYVFSGRYVTDDSEAIGIAERGTFTASFKDSWRSGLVIRLVPDGSSSTSS